ncbi:MAG: hypothetical protein RBU25_14680 [Lentisphaeria bacterium]|jgi:hypothetical protein|nr:hypothetical protein [Lentisphaeria bacterium]
MKRNPVQAHAREMMERGRLARDGFLGDDMRPLDEIVAADAAALAAAGVTRGNLADLLDELHAAADAALETPRELFGGKVQVQLIEVMGRIPCPFGCGERAHKAAIRVKAGDLAFVFTPLQAHLIREHGFFQGEGSWFRLEPAELIALYRLCRG